MNVQMNIQINKGPHSSNFPSSRHPCLFSDFISLNGSKKWEVILRYPSHSFGTLESLLCNICHCSYSSKFGELSLNFEGWEICVQRFETHKMGLKIHELFFDTSENRIPTTSFISHFSDKRRKSWSKGCKNKLHSPFLWLLAVANEHKQLLLLGHREHSTRYPG